VSPRRPREARPALDGRGARVAAFDLLARKAWSGRELRVRLVRRGAPAEVARDVVAELEGKGYVDDQAFARWWAEARARGRRVGSLRLTQELRAKGIAPALVSAAVESAFAEIPEPERALEAARRRLPALLRTRPDRAAARLRDYLLRRGYPAGAVRAAVTAVLGSQDPSPGG
jgi:regulatory protein